MTRREQRDLARRFLGFVGDTENEQVLTPFLRSLVERGIVKLTKIELTDHQDVGLESRRKPSMLGIRLGRSTSTRQCPHDSSTNGLINDYKEHRQKETP